MKSHDMIIDPRHVMLLGDVMTYKASNTNVTPIDNAACADLRLRRSTKYRARSLELRGLE